VLRDGGRLAYAIFGRPGQNPWITSLARAIDEAGQHPAGDPSGPDGPFFFLAEPDCAVCGVGGRSVPGTMAWFRRPAGHGWARFVP